MDLYDFEDLPSQPKNFKWLHWNIRRRHIITPPTADSFWISSLAEEKRWNWFAYMTQTSAISDVYKEGE